jgi:hypothetical protein
MHPGIPRLHARPLLAHRVTGHGTRTLLVVLSLALPLAAEAQGKTVSVHVSDSASWIVPRQPHDVAREELKTRDRNYVVLLTDTALVLQLTRQGMEKVDRDLRDMPRENMGLRLIARIVGAGVGELLDHGIAYRLSALREARAEGSRLVLEDLDGRRVFDRVEVNGRDVMDDFSPPSAEWFAREINRAIRRQH